MIDKTVDQWRTHSCVHVLRLKAITLSQISEEDNIENRSFLWLMFSQVV